MVKHCMLALAALAFAGCSLYSVADGCGPVEDGGNCYIPGTSTCVQPLCDGICCASTATCLGDSSGTKTCATSCATSAGCTEVAASCCVKLSSGSGACVAAEADAGQQCL